METGRIIGGIIALLAGVLIFIMALQFTLVLGSQPVMWIINLSVAILAIIGGILGIMTNKLGGKIALIAGLLAIICEVIATTDPSNLAAYFNQLSFIGDYIFIPWITVEGVLMAIGGIIIFTSTE